jgi:hypothetical protein
MKIVVFAVVLTQTALTSFAQFSFKQERDLETEQLKYELLDLQERTEDLSADISKLKRTADMYEREDYEHQLRKLQKQAEEISAEASHLDAFEAADSLENTAGQLKKARHEIELEPRTFYTERDYWLDNRLKKSFNSAEEAAGAIEDRSFELESAEDE